MNSKYDLGSSPSLKQLVYDNLQKMIITGELQPGERLTEDDLSRVMNISRAPIREALNMLERDGFTQMIPRRGAIVAEVSVKDARDIWDCRLALEPYAAKEAFPNIPPEKIDLALSHIEKLEREYVFEDYIDSDLEVHELYYQYLDNPYMQSILSNLKAHSIRVRWLHERQQNDLGSIAASIREHRGILEAFQHGTDTEVYDAVYQHISNSSHRLLD